MTSKYTRSLCVVLMVWFGGGVACGGTQEPREAASDEVIGKPPSEKDDPFYMMEVPEEAESASTSGYIGPEEKDDKSSESEADAVRASKAKPPEDQKKQLQEEAEAEQGTQCYACVRICPMTSESGAGSGGADCSGGERDVICGWGMHSEKSSARELAAAECNGALDMAREMNQWSRIDGECPPPTCRAGDGR